MNVAYSGSPGSADNVTSPIQRGPQIVEHRPDCTSESVRTRSFARTGASDPFRRISVGAGYSGDGRLTERSADARAGQYELILMPRSGRELGLYSGVSTWPFSVAPGGHGRLQQLRA